MKVKEIIKELQKYDENLHLELFINEERYFTVSVNPGILSTEEQYVLICAGEKSDKR